MSLKLGYQEKLDVGIKRILMEESKEAIEVIKSNIKKESHLAVHEARKSMKKIRATYRLIRYEIDNYSEKNTFYRDLSRTLSDIRDATSTIEALNLLKEQYEDSLYKNAFHDLEKYLVKRRENMSKEAFENADLLSSVQESLEGELEDLKRISFELDGFDAIAKGLYRVYNRGKKGLERSMDNPTTDNFHEWRRRAKYLRYHLQILERTWPAIMDEMEDELHEITDLLGHDHDLSIIDEISKTKYQIFKNESDRSLFNGLLREQRKNLQFHALRLGEKFYFDEPDYFIDRLKQYWKSHEKEIKQEEIIEMNALEY